MSLRHDPSSAGTLSFIWNDMIVFINPLQYIITWNFRDFEVLIFRDTFIFCILNHFNFAFLSETLFISLAMSTNQVPYII